MEKGKEIEYESVISLFKSLFKFMIAPLNSLDSLQEILLCGTPLWIHKDYVVVCALQFVSAYSHQFI